MHFVQFLDDVSADLSFPVRKLRNNDGDIELAVRRCVQYRICIEVLRLPEGVF